MALVLDLPVRRLRGNVAEICFRCSVSRLGDVVFVGSEARVYWEVAPLVTYWCWLARRDIAKAVLVGGYPQGWSSIYVKTGSRHNARRMYFDGDCRSARCG